MARHTELDVAPTKGEYVDGAQGVHAVPPCPLTHVPAGQVSHRGIPYVGAMEPGAQNSHASDVAFAKKPGVHGEHETVGALAFADTAPGAHEHAEAPVDTASVCAPQSAHAVAPVAGAKVPTGQAAGGGGGGVNRWGRGSAAGSPRTPPHARVQAAFPTLLLEKVPTGHKVHDEAPWEP